MTAIGTSDAYAHKPWLQVRPRGGPEMLQPRFGDMLSAFREAARGSPDAAAIHYFDATIDYARLDELSDAFAVWLGRHGVESGDRVMIILQNVPQFTIATLGVWKVGATPVPGNPMYRDGELRKLFGDCTPKAVVCHRDHHQVVTAALAAAQVEAAVLTTSPHEFQSRGDGRALPPDVATPDGAADFMAALAGLSGLQPPPISLSSEALGLLLYTSGTTGTPKGAMISHGALAFNAQLSCEWFVVPPGGRLLTVAPLFHITGFTVHLAVAMIAAGSTILTYRFEPDVVLEAMLEHRPHLGVAAITAFIALMNRPHAAAEHFSSFTGLFTGGAPVPPSVVEDFGARFGKRIYSTYGMTETCAPTHISPPGSTAPVDPASGALAIGIPVSNVQAMIADDAGRAAPVTEVGELWVRGPQVMLGYWNKPQETAAALAGGWMHTGDVGFMDAEGWFYLVDRKTDVINASGFKVWPREVEDVLYSHAAIQEAAVVGVPDAYRGETVKAFVSLKDGATVQPEDLVAFCRERLAAYKCPRMIEIMSELPKTASGKIMRSALRTA
jgi:long-chain acyl-CoA synthetase